MNHFSKAFLTLTIVAFLSGCGGGGASPDPDPDPDPGELPDPDPDPDPDPEPDPDPPPLGTPENPFNARGITSTQAPDPQLTANAPRATSSGIEAVFDENGLFLFTVQEGYGSATDYLCNLVPDQVVCTAVDGATIGASGSGPAINGEFSAAIVLSATFDDGAGTYTQLSPVYFETSQSTAADVVLPTGVVVYTGEAAGQGMVGATSGLVSGTFVLTSDFGTNLVDGTITGVLPGQVAVSGAWTDAALDPDSTSFAGDAGTDFTFQGNAASGLVDGGFFGPQSQEVAGALWLESADGSNSVSMILLGTPQP